MLRGEKKPLGKILTWKIATKDFKIKIEHFKDHKV